MQLANYEKTDYSGGLNSTASPREIAANEASNLQNWDITFMGQLRRRDGLTRVGGLGSYPITGLGAFVRDTGADLVRTQGNNFEYLNGASWAVLQNNLIIGNQFWLENVQALNRIYIGNQDNTLKQWDRASTAVNSLVDLGAAVPHGNVMVWYKNFMFHLNHVVVGSTIYQEDLFWSNLGDPDTYDTTNNHTKVPGDGRLITAVPMGSSLVLFKERSIQYLTGFGSASWQITGSASSYNSISEEVGCIAPRGACQVGDEVWFVDNQAHIRRVTKTDFDAFRHDIISKKIQGTLDGINKIQLSKTVAWAWNNKVYFAVPNATDTENSLVFVFDILASRRITQSPWFPEEAWTTYTGWHPSIGVTYPTATTLDLYIGDALSGKVYKHAGLDDDGVAINAVFEDKDDDFGARDQFKNYKFGYTSGQASTTNTNINIDSSIDGAPYVNSGILSLLGTGSRVAPTGDARCAPTGSARCGGKIYNTLRYTYDQNGQYPLGKRLRHRVTHNAIAQQPILNTFTSHFKPRALR